MGPIRITTGMIEDDRIFADRKEAGVELGKMLEDEYKNKNVLVVGIPRGGIMIAHEVAKILSAELSVIIAKKLPHPLHQEVAVGAVAEDGSVYLTSLARDISKNSIKKILREQQAEILSRIQRFRWGRPLPEMFRRVVIIVDDGIATGSTIVPAIKLCKHKQAVKVVVAAPVSGKKYVPEIDELADEVIITTRPPYFYSVGQVYEDFHQVSDEEVIDLLDYEKIKTVS